MHRALALTALLLTPLLLVPTAAAEPDPLEDFGACVGSGHWSTYAARVTGCLGACIGWGHWSTFPARVLGCLD